MMSLSGRVAIGIVAASVAGGVLLFESVAPATAQAVRGTLVEYPRGAAVPGGAVTLLDSTGVAVDSTTATVDGIFTLHARRAGVHTLYFSRAGYASVPSGPIRLNAGETVAHEFAVPLISGAAIRRMSEVIDVEKRLQSDLTELCGEPLRPESAGILVGVVRRRPGGEPLAGAIVQVEASGQPREEAFHRATVTSANGVYVICNVPAGQAAARTDLVGFRADDGPVDIRAGEIAWYDVHLRPLRGR